MPRIKCSVLDRPKEKIFIRIATRGVVKFFNVCSEEQKELESKLESTTSEIKKEKILASIDKGSFLDKLKEANKYDEEELDSKSDETKPNWSVLRPEFILGNENGKIKNWDKIEIANGEEENNDGDANGDDDSDNEIPINKKSNKNKKPPTKNRKNKNKKFKKNK